MSCIQFHCLLIALLIGYVKALQEYDGLYKLEGQILQGKGDIKREELTPKMRDSQRLIWMYGRFIWTITTSGMFDAHLQAMTTALIGIRSANETTYTVFSISLGLEVAHSGDGNSDEEEEGDPDVGMFKGGEEDVEEDHRWGINDTQHVDSVIRFKCWTCIITGYFSSLRLLTQAVIPVKNDPQTFEAKLVLVMPCEDRSPLD
jgi:hypothetical protein